MHLSIEHREGQWHVIADGEVAGSHDSRTDAIKQQRGLYAQEGRTAALVLVEEEPEVMEEEVLDPRVAAALDRLSLVSREQRDERITNAIVAAFDAIATRITAGEQLTEAMVASLRELAGQPIVVNVPQQAPPIVNVEVPVPGPRQVNFTRDSSGRIIEADIEAAEEISG